MDPLTSISATKAFRQLLSEDYVDWAGEMLVAGYDSYSLCILAGLDRRASSFETENYFARALKELNLSLPDPDAAVRVYGCEIAQQILDGKITAQDGVRKLSHICVGLIYEPDFIGWYELEEALDSILYGHPYGEVTLENFDELTKKEAVDFIADVCSVPAT